MAKRKPEYNEGPKAGNAFAAAMTKILATPPKKKPDASTGKYVREKI